MFAKKLGNFIMPKLDGVYMHPNAIVETEEIGVGTRIWAFVHILKGAKIGRNVNIGDHCFIENNVVIGNNVVIKNGISIWDGVIIKDDAFLGPNVVLTNELFPRSGFPKGLEKTLIKKGVTIGANATLVTGITLGKYCTIGAGSVVTKNVLDYALMYGNPARQKGWVCVCGLKLNFNKKNEAKCICGRNFFIENKEVNLK
jgi:acetyltransferase-like isoleucine patch superfamily enzyme